MGIKPTKLHVITLTTAVVLLILIAGILWWVQSPDCPGYPNVGKDNIISVSIVSVDPDGIITRIAEAFNGIIVTQQLPLAQDQDRYLIEFPGRNYDETEEIAKNIRALKNPDILTVEHFVLICPPIPLSNF